MSSSYQPISSPVPVGWSSGCQGIESISKSWPQIALRLGIKTNFIRNVKAFFKSLFFKAWQLPRIPWNWPKLWSKLDMNLLEQDKPGPWWENQHWHCHPCLSILDIFGNVTDFWVFIEDWDLNWSGSVFQPSFLIKLHSVGQKWNASF